MMLCGLWLRVLLMLIGPAGAADLMHFWDEPQRGANSFNRAPPDSAYFEALARTGASWVRLTFSKWDGLGPDFLLGDADRYAGLPATDLAILVEVLDAATRPV